MANLLALIFVVFVIGFGVSACWAITANGASQHPTTDTFGNQPSNTAIQQDNQSSNLATSTMPILVIIFIIAVCATIAAVVIWLWKTGNGQTGKTGY
jgi:cytochrome bd-type quinol oxidase subunit 1